MNAGFLNFLRYMNAAYNPFIDRSRNHLVEKMLKSSTCCTNQSHLDYCQCLLITTVTAVLIVISIYKGRAWMNYLKKGLKSCYPPHENTNTKLENLHESSEVIDYYFPEHKIGDFKRQISNAAEEIDSDTSDGDVKQVFESARIIDKDTIIYNRHIIDEDEENVSNTGEIIDNRDTSDEDEKQVCNTAEKIDRDMSDKDDKHVNTTEEKNKDISDEKHATNTTEKAESANSAKMRTLTILSSKPSSFEEKSTQTNFETACRKCRCLSTLDAELDKFCLNAIGDLDAEIKESTNEKLVHYPTSIIIDPKSPRKRRWNIEIEFNPNVLNA